MRLAKFFLCTILLIFSFTSFAQDESLPTCPGGNQIHVSVTPNTAFETGTAAFHFQYSVTSFPDSTQNVWTLIVEFLNEEDEPSNANGPSGWSGGRVANLNTNVPQNPLPEYAPKHIVDWISFSSATDILPGNSQSGFIFDSHALPGIARSWTSGYHEVPGVEGDVGEATCSPAAPYSPDDNIILKTVGPDVLPANLTIDQLLSRLISLKEQAFNLGWIDNAGVANALDAKLKEAKLKLQAGDTRVAINILKSFILDLEAQHQGQTGQGNGATNGNAQTSGKHVTDNAYYLLKPNAEFILYKLGVTSFP